MSIAELKAELVSRIANLEDIAVMEQIKMLLDSEDNDNNKSQIPDWFMSELLERKRAYENGEAKTVSWEECKKALLERVDR